MVGLLKGASCPSSSVLSRGLLLNSSTPSYEDMFILKSLKMESSIGNAGVGLFFEKKPNKQNKGGIPQEK